MWILVAAIWAIGIALTLLVARWEPLLDSVEIPWIVLLVMFAIAERAVFHLRFKKDAHSFSLSEIPLVIALFVVSPLAAITAQLAANVLALLHRRQQPVKIMFNLGQFAVQTSLAIIIFRPIVSLGEAIGPAGWIAAIIGAVVALIAAEIMINAVIHLSGGRLSLRESVEVMMLTALATVMNTATALIGVVLLDVYPTAAWLTAVPPIILFVAYRAYVNQREESGRLGSLYEATRSLHASPQIESALQAAVESARDMVDAEYAEAFLFPIDGNDAFATSIGPSDNLRVMEVATDDATEAMRSLAIAASDGLVTKPFEHLVGASTLLVDEAIVAPMLSGNRVVGVLMAVNRLGDVSRFVAEDVGLVETLAGQVAVSLENGRLGESLAQITSLKEQLEELVKSKDEFVASVSHELRTPLTAVAGLADELQQAPGDFSETETREFIRLIAEQSNELAGIVEDLLVAGQTEMGSQNLNIEQIDLGAEIREIVSSANRSGLGGELTLGAVDETIAALGDPLRVRQILRNLLTNAARYGGTEVRVEVGRTEAAAWLAVIDNGDGVPKRDSDRIFASYQRSGNAEQQPKSVGLGLSVSRKLARLMSGDLTYTRDQGLTRFELTLPAARPVAPSISEIDSAKPVTAQI
ncbi:MAG: GAF domain-containing protein [bacterium]|nr:GAF domain-containing protein [bacterium]